MNFPRLSIVPVDDMHHLSDFKIDLSEVVLCALVGFSLQGKRVLGPYSEDSSPVIMVFMKSGSLFVESSMSCESWVYG